MASIMRPHHLTSTSRALYRVFVAPNLSATPSLRAQNESVSGPFKTILPRISIRTKYFKAPAQRHSLKDAYTLDNAINTDRINLVNESGVFQPDIALTDALRTYNRVTHHMVQMSPGRVDEFGIADPSNLPTCKIISKMELRAQHQRKLEIERRQSKGLGAGPAGKSLELNWAIAGGDLQHRLRKMAEFLGEGRKVEVLLGPKRRGRKASAEECKAVLQAVRAAAGECKGASEAKCEGAEGGVMTLVFEGRKLEDKGAGK